MRQWIRKYSLTPSWTVNLKILLDIRVTVTFQRAFQPSAGLSYWKIGTRQMCMKWLPIIRHVNSVEQCRTVSTVSTVIARCYLHLRWYFLLFFHAPSPKGLGWLRGLSGLISLLYIYCHMVRTPLGIGYMAFWGFQAKCRLLKGPAGHCIALRDDVKEIPCIVLYFRNRNQ